MCTLFRFKLTFTTLMFTYQSIAFLNLKSLSYFKIAIPVFPKFLPGPRLKSIKGPGFAGAGIPVGP